MLDRPLLTDAVIAAVVRDQYGLEITALEFLAFGQDADAWTFRGRGGPGGDVFVKIRRGIDTSRLRAVSAESSSRTDGRRVQPPASDPAIDPGTSMS